MDYSFVKSHLTFLKLMLFPQMLLNTGYAYLEFVLYFNTVT
jgi:hypothetical protein